MLVVAEIVVLEDGDVGRDRGGDAFDPQLAECSEGAVDGDLPRAAPDDELADEVVVELTDLVAGFVAGVPAGAETIGWGERRDRAGGREERATGRILRVDADLDGVTADLDLVLGER